MTPKPFSERLSLWQVDRSPTYPEILLDFIEKLAEKQPLPPPAQTWDELQARRAPLQLRLRRSLGLDPWPERPPFNHRITGSIGKEGYRIEKVIFEAWGGLPVTAHLYIPEPCSHPSPGLIYACGHWMEAGKLAVDVQAFCGTAASLGIVVLVYDPIGQGERLDSWRDHGHLHGLVVGMSQLGFMVWESIRALDYLLTRPEIDPKRIAMTGASGGGLNTLFTTAIEDRFACAIPAAYPCTFSHAMKSERDLNWEDGTDVCNQVPEVMSYADMADIGSLFIPKPYLVVSGTRDKIFPIEGVRQFAAAMQRNYALAGVPERFCFQEFDEEHGYQVSLRQAAYGWLKRWILESGDGSPITEPNLALFPNPYPVDYMAPPAPTPENVRWQSPTPFPEPGSVVALCLQDGEKISSEAVIDQIVLNEAGCGSPAGMPPEGVQGLLAWQEEITRDIRAVLGPFPEKEALGTRLFNQVWEDGLMVERVTFTSEDGITIPGLFVMPEEWKRPTPFVVYTGEWGKQQGIRSGMIWDFVKKGFGVLAVDVRGVGETAASEFEAATNLLMMDRTLFGQRVWDVIRAVDFLWERCYIAPQIDKGRLVVAGEGVGALWALYAAALDRRVAAVVAVDMLCSYRELLPHRVRFPTSIYLFDVLNHFDLAHVAATCAPRPVYIRPVDGRRKVCARQDAVDVFKPAAQAYSMVESAKRNLVIDTRKHPQGVGEWLDKALSDRQRGDDHGVE